MNRGHYKIDGPLGALNERHFFLHFPCLHFDSQCLVQKDLALESSLEQKLLTQYDTGQQSKGVSGALKGKVFMSFHFPLHRSESLDYLSQKKTIYEQ